MAQDGAGGADEAVDAAPLTQAAEASTGLGWRAWGRLSGGGESRAPGTACCLQMLPPPLGLRTRPLFFFPEFYGSRVPSKGRQREKVRKVPKMDWYCTEVRKKNKCDIYLTFNVVEKCTPMSLSLPSVARVFISDRFYWKWFIIGWRYVCLNSLFSDSVRYFQRKKK